MMPDDDALVEWLRDLVEVETPSGDIEALDEGFAVLGAQVESAFGRPPIISRVDGTPYLYLPAVAQPSVLVIGHLDTVWPRGTLAEIPFTVIDDVARGPGVLDMKAGLVIANAAAAHCEILEHIGLQIGPGTDLDDLEQGRDGVVVIGRAAAPDQLTEPKKQVLQSQVGPNALVEGVFVQDHGNVGSKPQKDGGGS